MKSILNISIISLPVLAFSFGIASCSDNYMNKINQDNDDPHDAPAVSILTDVLTSTAFHDIGGDMDTYISTYNEYEVGVGNQLWQAQKRIGTSSSTTFGDSWNDVYSDLRNARLIISKSAATSSYNAKGMGEVLSAITSAIITDNFGDAPYSQAALPYLVNGVPAYMNPKLDTQESVYDSVMNYLNAAIHDFNTAIAEGSDADNPGSYDLLYNGDPTGWKKLAYGLKARYTMRLYDTYNAADKVSKMKDVISYADSSFQSVSDQAAYNWYSSSNRNPYYDLFVSRQGYLAISPTYLAKLAARNDPRLNRIMVALVQDSHGNHIDQQLSSEDYYQGKDSVVAPINGGGSDDAGGYNVSVFCYGATAPTFYMSYHELMFLEAEAYERLGDLADAKTALKTAVVAAIANTENNVTDVANCANEIGNDWGEIVLNTSAITPAQASSYFDTNVSPLFVANPLQEIEIQKYLGLFGCNGEATEAYADIRRHKAANEDYYNFGNPLDTTEYPWELPYGSSAVTSNANVITAYGNGQYVYQNCLWWAGGTGKASK